MPNDGYRVEVHDGITYYYNKYDEYFTLETDQKTGITIKKNYFDGFLTSIRETQENGNYKETFYDDEMDGIVEVGDSLGNYERHKGDILVAKKTVDANDVSHIIEYYDDGKISYESSTVNGVTNEKMYNEKGLLIGDIDEKKHVRYIYFENNDIKEKLIINNETDEIISTEYSEYDHNYRTEICKSKKGKIKYKKTGLEGEEPIISIECSYYDNGNPQSVIYKSNYGHEREYCQYDYDQDGNAKVKSSYYLNGQLIGTFDEKAVSFEYIDEDKGGFSLNIEFKNTSISIDENGKRTYYNGEEYDTFILNPDGTYEFPNRNMSGTYQINDGVITLTDANNNQFTYSAKGIIISKNENGVITEYNEEKGSEKTTKNGKVSYGAINHIEYDEDSYDMIMKTMVSLYEEYPKKINKNAKDINDTINTFEDKYSGKNINDIDKKVNTHIKEIDELKTSINYSLLAYRTCDEGLKNQLNSLIDSLFDENENQLAKYFKKNIASTIEDNDNDKILEYKESTDFNNLLNNVLPVYQYQDDQGNTWYFNQKNKLVSATGDNLKINYGNEEFQVSFNEDGLIKLIDSNGNPLNIFGDYNCDSGQYGGDQTIFRNTNMLINDDNIMRLVNEHFPESADESLHNLLNKIANTGCGRVALANTIFKEFEGDEEGFYKTFGFPMYDVKRIKDNMSVDYNYEPIILDLSCYNYNRNDLVESAQEKLFDTDELAASMAYDYVQKKYGVFNEPFNDVMKKNYVFSDRGYNIYNLDGTPYYMNGGGHAMTKIGETDDGLWVVSTWGKKYLCEPNQPSLYHYEEFNNKHD